MYSSSLHNSFQQQQEQQQLYSIIISKYSPSCSKIYKMVEIIEALIHKIMTSKNLEEIKRLTINYR